MKDVKFKGISVIRYAFIFKYLEALDYKLNPFASAVLTWGNKSSIKATDVVRIEDGFIRSVGLGVHFKQPLSLIFDSTGIYFDATRPSDLENIFNNTQFDNELVSRANFIRNRLVELGISKYNVGNELDFQFPLNNKVILVPGQVEGDASIQFGSPTIKTNLDLLQNVRRKNSGAYIIYKPHPDVVTGERDNGVWQADMSKYADVIITDASIDKVLNVVDEVHTMTSLTGFEALLRGKKVTTYGLPFYACWGLTTDMESCKRRKRTLSLTELVAGTLILYPTYIDPFSRKLCTVEHAIELINKQKKSGCNTKTYTQYLLLFLKKIKYFL